MELSYWKFLQLVIKKKNDRFCYRLQSSPYFCTCQELKKAVEAPGGHPQNWFCGKKDDGIRTTATRRRLFWSLFLICYISF